MRKHVITLPASSSAARTPVKVKTSGHGVFIASDLRGFHVRMSVDQQSDEHAIPIAAGMFIPADKMEGFRVLYFHHQTNTGNLQLTFYVTDDRGSKVLPGPNYPTEIFDDAVDGVSLSDNYEPSGRIMTSFARPNDVTAYAANDVICPDPTTVMRFVGAARQRHGSGVVFGAGCYVQDNPAAPLTGLELLLFASSTIAFIQADNSQLAISDNNTEDCIGSVPLDRSSIVNTGAGIAGGILYEGDCSLAFKSLESASGGRDLFGILVTREAFTPVAECAFRPFIHVARD